MKKLGFMAFAMVVTLTGCGGDDGSGSTTAGSSGETAASESEVLAQLSTQLTQYTVTNTGSNAAKCNFSVGNTYETDNFFVEAIDPSISEYDLMEAAQVAEVALAELQSEASLTDAELGLDSAKWTICYNTNSQYSGSAHFDGFDLRLDAEKNIRDIFRISKHELVHVAANQFYGTSTPSDNVYRWFSEALAVMIAQTDDALSTPELDDYATSVNASPVTAIDHNTTLEDNYGNMYAVYMTTLSALSSKYDVTLREWFDVYTGTNSSGDFETAFDSFMASQGASSFSHDNLESLITWQSEVRNYVESQMQTSANFTSDYDLEGIYINSISYKYDGVSAFASSPATSGAVYYHPDTITNGVHTVEAMVVDGSNYYEVGPVNVTFSNGQVVGGSIDLTGLELKPSTMD